MTISKKKNCNLQNSFYFNKACKREREILRFNDGDEKSENTSQKKKKKKKEQFILIRELGCQNNSQAAKEDEDGH